MFDYDIARQNIKLTLLDEQLRAADLAGFTGLSQRGDRVVAHFDAPPAPAALATLDALIGAHDPAALTRAEQAERAAQAHASTLKGEWYAIVTADPAALDQALDDIQVTLAAAHAAFQAGDTATGVRRLLAAQVASAQLGQTAMRHLLVLTRVLREVMRRGGAPDILTDPDQL